MCQAWYRSDITVKVDSKSSTRLLVSDIFCVIACMGVVRECVRPDLALI